MLLPSLLTQACSLCDGKCGFSQVGLYRSYSSYSEEEKLALPHNHRGRETYSSPDPVDLISEKTPVDLAWVIYSLLNNPTGQ